LVNEQIEAGARFLRAFHQYAPVQSAFWLKGGEYGHWFLYVASEQITDANFDVGYGEVVRIADELHDPWFDMFQVKLIGADHPLAKAALEAQHRYPGRTPLRIRETPFGGIYAEEVYIYPALVSAASS
jgi:hypothetical protein